MSRLDRVGRSSRASRLAGSVFSLVVCVAGTAHGQSLPRSFRHAQAYIEAGLSSARRPVPAPAGVRVDDAAVFFHAENDARGVEFRRWNPGWRFRASYAVFGTIAPNSLFRFVLKQGGRTLFDQRCEGTIRGGYMYTTDACGNRDTTVQALGRIEVEAHFIDGQTDVDTLLRTHTIEVGSVARLSGNGVRDVSRQYVNYAARTLDNVVFRNSSQNNSGGNMLVARFMYAVPAGGSTLPGVPQLRCRVDGAPITFAQGLQTHVADDSVSDTREYVERSVIPPGSTAPVNEAVHWAPFTVTLPITWGADYGAGRLDQAPSLEEHPGAWACELRAEGETIRSFSFVVANGDILAHPEEGAGLSLPPGVHLLSTTVPANSSFDMRVDPAAVRAGGFFGRPWGTDAGRAMAAAVPAIGTPAPPQATQTDWGNDTSGGFDVRASSAPAARAPAAGASPARRRR